MIISFPTDCQTLLDTKPQRRPNHWKWTNKKEYQAWWYQQNREKYKAEVLRKYHEKKKSKLNFK